ncbi:hypothetical protein [Ferrovum sp.]|uniref:hypothetical protein n=1 Tax=Ferrovum sp. TaxID=2609467 RepID=UPI00260B4894|nr:hypothetical protein [Ferrovum sp.]
MKSKIVDLTEQKEKALLTGLNETDFEEFDEFQEACEIGAVRQQVKSSQHRSEREFYQF